MARIYQWESIVNNAKCQALSAMICLLILCSMSMYVNYIALYFFFGLLSLMPLIGPVVTLWMPKKRISPEGKAVFISGCDSGFGYMLAKRLDQIGFQVFAGCLFPEGDGASKLRKFGSERLHVIPLDVTSDSSVEEATAYVEKTLNNNVLWALVNNAGITSVGEIYWMSMETIKKITEVNTLGVIRVTKAFLPKLKESKGKILTMASQAGNTSAPGIVAYCASKAAIIRFCEGLRLELYKWGIQVITMEPYFHRTSIIHNEEVSRNSQKEWAKVPKDTKDLYASNYIENFIQKMLFFFQISASHPRGVVSLMEKVIMDSHPADSYAPGSHILRLATWIQERLPQPVGDMAKLYTVLGSDLM